MEVLTGSARPMGLVLAVLLLISLDWFSSTLYRYIQLDERTLAQSYGIPYDWTSYLGLAPFIFLAVILLVLVRRAANQIDVDVRTDRHRVPAKHLILFLSPLNDKSVLTEVSGDISDPEVRAKLARTSWRMPVEGIAKHLPGLEQVIVIASSDGRATGNKPGSAGTYRELPEFKALIARLTEHYGVTVMGLHDLVRGHAKGIDFENTRALVDALQAVYKTLHERHVSDKDILMDITGGMKPATVAGATVALAKGRHFQYVSTNTYEVLTYDVTYKL